MNELWNLRIKTKQLDVHAVFNFYFAIEVADETATYRERASELAVSLTGTFGWWEKFRTCFSVNTRFESVLFQKQYPTRGWWDDGSIAFSDQLGSWIFPVRGFDCHCLVRWISGLEGIKSGWTTLGPMPWVLFENGQMNDTGYAVVSDWATQHAMTRLGVLGDTIRGALPSNEGSPLPIIGHHVNSFIGCSSRRRRKN